MSAGTVAVFDIGKTNAKLALVDGESLREIEVLNRPNTVKQRPPWPHFDVDGLWLFLTDGLRRFQEAYGVGRITITTHGASIALIGENGLAAPVLDYEHDGPDLAAEAYDAIRPPFSETGSPRLPMGLNVGAQLFWQFETDPGLKTRVRSVVTYPEYWVWRLTGVAACEVSSLGAHTDLWNPFDSEFSSVVERLGIADRMAPVRRAGEVIGPVLPEVAREIGLDPSTMVHCGIHDSNASLVPHLLGQDAPFSVVSSGTWVIAMAVGGHDVRLDPAKDTLMNVNAFGAPVPSARFMGGREHDMLTHGTCPAPSDDDILAILSGPVMVLPAVVASSGPFQGLAAEWVGNEPVAGSGRLAAATAMYLALETAHCLKLIGHRGRVHVEGPFARNGLYCAALAVLTGDAVTPMDSATGTSQGAALLCRPRAFRLPKGQEITAETVPWAAEIREYAQVWRSRVGVDL